MTNTELWAAWQFWMAVAGVIVLVAAALLIAIWLTARRILSEAARALAAAGRIERQTRAIWSLETTNDVAARMLDTVTALERKGTALVGAIEGRPTAERR